MKQFVLRSFVFITLIFFLLALISLGNISSAKIIQTTFDTSYDKVAWNIHQIYSKPNSLDSAVVFFGDSRTQGNISDSILSNQGIKSVNLGVNHPGPELEWFFTKETLGQSSPCLCVYSNNLPSSGIHNMSPLTIPTIDLLKALDYRVPTTWFINFFPRKIAFVLEDFAGSFLNSSENFEFKFSQFGQRFEKNRLSPKLANYQSTKSSREQEEVHIIRQIWRNLLKKYHFFTAQNQTLRTQSMTMCGRSMILKLPAYLSPPNGEEFNGFEIPLREICSNTEFWFDRNHLNQKGAEKYTHEVILPLIQLEIEKME